MSGIPKELKGRALAAQSVGNRARGKFDLICGRDEAVAAWVKARMPWVSSFGTCTAIGVLHRRQLIAGMVYYDYSSPNIACAFAADNFAWPQVGVLGGLFQYPFGQLGCARITTYVREGDERALGFARTLGFLDEGVHRRLFPDGSTGISLGMLREECRWLPKNGSAA